jgi:hypothetical protein
MINHQYIKKTNLTITENHQQTKKFHFQEINVILCFPTQGNQGKYRTYCVQLKKPETAKQNGVQTMLGEFLDKQEVENGYPHTVGYFKESTGEGDSFEPEYLELRKIYTVEDFWLFLNACNI